jgi:hypothetical protein
MNHSGENSKTGASGPGDFEETLRLIARLSTPEGLDERVQARLRAAPAAGGARILAWPTALRLDSAWMRSAAAAAIVAVVVGGCFGVYSRVESIQPARAVTVPLHFYTQGGFSSAGAMRTPRTLNGPMVEHPAATPSMPANPAVGPAARPRQASELPSKSKAANKAVIRPAAPPKN